MSGLIRIYGRYTREANFLRGVAAPQYTEVKDGRLCSDVPWLEVTFVHASGQFIKTIQAQGTPRWSIAHMCGQWFFAFYFALLGSYFFLPNIWHSWYRAWGVQFSTKADDMCRFAASALVPHDSNVLLFFGLELLGISVGVWMAGTAAPFIDLSFHAIFISSCA